jgi:hypothetical protein
VEFHKQVQEQVAFQEEEVCRTGKEQAEFQEQEVSRYWYTR